METTVDRRKLKLDPRDPKTSPSNTNEFILCACGCGMMLTRFHKKGKYERRFIPGHNSKLKRRAIIPFICPTCHKIFERTKSQITSKAALRFCSRNCSARYYTGDFGERNKERSRKAGSKFTGTCPTCGKMFERYHCQHPKSKRHFCSSKCLRHTEETKRKMSYIHTFKNKHAPRLTSKPHKLFMQLFQNKFGTELEKEFELVTEDGRSKFYDCKIPNKSILFEIDGMFWHSSSFAKQNDQIKEELAKHLGYTLYRVPENKIIEFIAMFKIEKVKDGSPYQAIKAQN